MIKTTYTKQGLENKISLLNTKFQNTIGMSSRRQIKNNINYYITLLAQFDESPTLKSIEA